MSHQTLVAAFVRREFAIPDSAANAHAVALQRGETVTAATARFNHKLRKRAREKDGREGEFSRGSNKLNEK